jgi:hypothetical protein
LWSAGVDPTAPGYAVAHVAPRLGPLACAKWRVPTPYGLIAIAATAALLIDSPVPVIVEREGHAPVHIPAGQHRIGATTEQNND